MKNFLSAAFTLMMVAGAMIAAAPAAADDRDGRPGYGGGRPSYPAYPTHPSYIQPAPPASYPQPPFTYGPPPAVYIPPGRPFLMPPPPQPVYPERWAPQHGAPYPQSGHSWDNGDRRHWQDRQQGGTVDDYRWRGDQDAQRWGSRNR